MEDSPNGQNTAFTGLNINQFNNPMAGPGQTQQIPSTSGTSTTNKRTYHTDTSEKGDITRDAQKRLKMVDPPRAHWLLRQKLFDDIYNVVRHHED